MNDFFKDLTNKPLSLTIMLAAFYYFFLKPDSDASLGNIGSPSGGVVGSGPSSGSTATFYAAQIYSALHPSGYSWAPDGTDEAALFRAATEAKLNGVRLDGLKTAYRSAYKLDLLADIQSEVSADELNRFIAICS